MYVRVYRDIKLARKNESQSRKYEFIEALEHRNYDYEIEYVRNFL